MYLALKQYLDSEETCVIERFKLGGRSPRYGNIPEFLFKSKVGSYLEQEARKQKWSSALWHHQTLALESLGKGDNVVVSTGTASGKSLVFHSFALHTCLMKPDSRVIVFYPLKALAADQIRGWQQMAEGLGLPKYVIGRIDGSVPVPEREQVLIESRVVVMTPDVCHAWLMSRLSLPSVRDFLCSLSLLVMDEAHTLEGVFGSNFAFLMRRLKAARNKLISTDTDPSPVQLIAATATIQNPSEHLKTLTGTDFRSVGHTEDGSRQYERIVAHVECIDGEEFRIARELHQYLLKVGRDGGFITFVDSRKGVERLALETNDDCAVERPSDLGGDGVLPYRAGYDKQDREQIERLLKEGELRGVVSTSALELGINIPHLCVGINVGVPTTRKAYRQRLGRIGRNSPGAFIIVAPRNAFSAFGTSFQEYDEMSVEPSYLYLDNRFMQFAHGRCLAVELESLGATPSIPTKVSWPKGFKEIYAAARPGGRRPPEFDGIASLGGDTPHYGYPLRNVGELNLKIKYNSTSDSIGDVNQLQALRECYPGAIYLHLTQIYKVQAWYLSSIESFVRVSSTNQRGFTAPRIRTWIHAGIAPVDLHENRLLRGSAGFLAECQMQITERVEGYKNLQSGVYYSYADLQQRNPNMRPRMRTFRTSGIILHLSANWFSNADLRCELADWLRDIFLREYSISPQDIGSAGTNIHVQGIDGTTTNYLIAVYDEIYGSLRLTEKLWLNFEHVVRRLCDAVESGSLDVDEKLAKEIPVLPREIATLSEHSGFQLGEKEPPNGCIQVFAKDSMVCYMQNGQMAVDVQVIQPTLMNGQLMYQIQTTPRPGQAAMKEWVSAASVQPSARADSWEYQWWSRETQEYVDSPT